MLLTFIYRKIFETIIRQYFFFTLQARLAEVESEAVELRLLWRTKCSTRSPGHARCALRGHAHAAPPSLLFLSQHGDVGEEEGCRQDEDDEDDLQICIKQAAGACRSETMKYRGISLLNEVDAQYSALQVKYDELLRQCGSGGGGPSLASSSSPGTDTTPTECQNHKAIQTQSQSHRHSVAACTDLMGDIQQPEYKELFREIFKCIQRTKEDLSEARGTPPACC